MPIPAQPDEPATSVASPETAVSNDHDSKATDPAPKNAPPRTKPVVKAKGITRRKTKPKDPARLEKVKRLLLAGRKVDVVAQKTGMHVTTVYYHLKRLQEQGLRLPQIGSMPGRKPGRTVVAVKAELLEPKLASPPKSLSLRGVRALGETHRAFWQETFARERIPSPWEMRYSAAVQEMMEGEDGPPTPE